MAGDHQHDLTVAEDDRTVTRTVHQLDYTDNLGNEVNVEWGSSEIKSGENVEIAIINYIPDKLHVHGEVNTSELKEDVMYEVVFVLMLKNNATTSDVMLEVKLPDGSVMEPAKQERTENLVSKPKQQWMEILAGDFKTIPNMNPGIIKFSLDIGPVEFQESGLVIKSVIFRPPSSTPLNPIAIQPWEINVRELSIYRGQLKDHWTWDVIQDGPISSNIFYEAVRLVDIVWLQVSGKYDASKLKIGSRYEVVFFIRLTDDAQGWENNRVTLQINGQAHSKPIDDTYKSKDFRELKVGNIKVDQPTMTNGIEFSLSETTSGLSKNGLVIKRVLLRPQHCAST